MKLKLALVGLVLALVAFAPAAQADSVTYNFDLANKPADLGNQASYGTVTLNLVGNDIQFVIDLIDGYYLVNSGMNQFDTFGFNTETPTLTASGFPTSYGPLSGYFAPGSNPPNNLDGWGSFNYSIAGPTVGGGGYANALTFTVNGDFGSVFDLVNANEKGYFFAAHIYNAAGVAGASTGFVTVGTTPTSVPEPASMLLLGTGLLGAGFFGRRRRNR